MRQEKKIVDDTDWPVVTPEKDYLGAVMVNELEMNRICLTELDALLNMDEKEPEVIGNGEEVAEEDAVATETGVTERNDGDAIIIAAGVITQEIREVGRVSF